MQKSLLYCMLILATLSSCQRPADQNRANLLKQEALYYYWNGNDYKKAEQEFFKGITIKGNHEAVERLLLKAYEANPNDLSLLYGIASSQILQGKLPEALKTYRKIMNKDKTQNLAAPLAYALYSKVNGDERSYKETIEHLEKEQPEAFRPFADLLSFIDNDVMKANLTAEPATVEGSPAIVVLGYALEKDGTMAQTLINRLMVALATAKANPQAPIIVSGGVPQQGVTESFRMKEWLTDQGIANERILIEDQSKDTVGNGVYSMKIVENLGVDQIILISSASHLRRAMSVFKAVSLADGYLLKTIKPFSTVDFKDTGASSAVNKNELMVIYRDAMRAYGFWAFPGMQQ